MAPVDLIQLRLRVGGKYSLVNRRCRCRLTANCPGWNRFYYLQGCNRHWRMLQPWRGGSAADGRHFVPVPAPLWLGSRREESANWLLGFPAHLRAISNWAR
jgi:hypothetical protein